jgi:c-di-GMP-binding flagellar brake protein YcgR
MESSQILRGKKIEKTLELVVARRAAAAMTHIAAGKWKTTNINFTVGNGNAIHMTIDNNELQGPINIQVDQPVGISFEHESERYIFETIVVGFEQTVNQNQNSEILLVIPEKMEKMGRRAYLRQDIPGNLNVKVLFWHRGYNDDSTEVPLENYWQGRLINLSAGGVQLAISLDQTPHFKIDQIVGLQFTPMPYEKPITLEGQVKHLEKTEDGRELILGVHALGLEANSQGRIILHRIIDVVNRYQHLNLPRNHAVTV